VVGLSLLLFGACTSQPAGTRPAKKSTDVITRDQISGKNFQSAYDVVEALHSNWLQIRNVTGSLGEGSGGASGGSAADTSRSGRPQVIHQRPIDDGRSPPGMNAGIQVYVDDVRVGGLGELRRISANAVYSIRRYIGSEAQTRYGVGHANGVIAISLQPEKP
jgi:hypothetical protein